MRRRRRGAVLLALALVAPLAAAQAAHAATVYELVGEWATGTPAQVVSGDPLASTWRFNLNDDAPAPGNAPVPNVTVVFTAENALFAEIPTMCLTSTTPASSISPDRRTLTCNVGERLQGSAEILLPGIEAHGPVGSEVGLSAQLAGITVALPRIPIVGDFAMDLRIDGGSPVVTIHDGANRVIIPWALRHTAGTEAGPATVSYDLSINFSEAGLLAELPTSGGAPVSGCVAQDRQQVGYPFSGPGHPADRTATLPACTLDLVGPNQLRLTLTGLDYTGATPASDSTGVALPSAWDVIAAGQFMFHFPAPTSGTTRVDVQASTPTYVSNPSGLVSTDDGANNASAGVVTIGEWFGGWVPDWQIPPGIGSFWTDTARALAGGRVLASSAVRPPVTGTAIVCSILDTRYVEWESSTLGLLPADSDVVDPLPGVSYEYYIGAGPGGILDPDDAAYEPNDFDCSAADAGWVSSVPAGAEVRAVRATATTVTSEANGEHNLLFLFTWQRIRDDVVVGQDIWFWTSVSQNGGATWIHAHRDSVPVPGATPTPGRYAYSYSGRDVLRTVPVVPVIAKDVDQEIAAPGGTVDYTITATPEAPLNGTNTLMTVVDTLPAGVSYVPGSASPEPDEIVGGTLTWRFPGGATNTPVVILFSATLPGSAVPGDLITNTASAEIDGLSREAYASTRVQAGGFTSLRKTVADNVVPQTGGVAENTWTLRLESHDSSTQAFTDTIDVLPYNGDGRGTDFAGDYMLAGPVDTTGVPGATVYYTTADPASISEDPDHPSNGQAGDASTSALWTTTFAPEATAVRVIGPALPPSAVHEFAITVETSGANPGDRYVNRAHARAGTTQLIVRTSSAFAIEGVTTPGRLSDTGAENVPAALAVALGAFALGLTALVAARVRVRRMTRED